MRVFLTFLLYWKKKEDACHQKILDQLEEILIRFRENKFDDLLKTENYAELEKLNDQLEAIGHHIQLIKEEARAEKENTKEMVSDISHQLKTPVAALDTCFSVLMQNDLSATEQEEFRIRCRSALDGLETLLQSLLEISKMETGLIQINKKKNFRLWILSYLLLTVLILKRMRKKLNSFLTMKKSWKHARLCRIKGGLVKL